MNNDLWKQVMQMNDANLLGSLTYTTKAQQPFKIAYNYTKTIFENINDYNTKRIKAKLKLSPVQYRTQFTEAA